MLRCGSGLQSSDGILSYSCYTLAACHSPGSRHDRRRPPVPKQARPEDARGQGALGHERAAPRPAGAHLRPAAGGGPGRMGAAPRRPARWATGRWTPPRRSWSPRSPSRCGRRSAPTGRRPRCWPPSRRLAPGRPCGGDLQQPGHALSLSTAVRYATAAGMAVQRAQRAFLAHRKAKAPGLVLPAPWLPPRPPTKPHERFAASADRAVVAAGAAPAGSGEARQGQGTRRARPARGRGARRRGLAGRAAGGRGRPRARGRAAASS